MASSSEAPRVGTERIQNIGFGFKHAGVLMAAIELSLFTKVSEGCDTLEAIASACGLSLLNTGYLDPHERFGRENRNARVGDSRFIRKRIANTKDSGIKESNNVTCKGLLDFFSIFAHEQRRIR